MAKLYCKLKNKLWKTHTKKHVMKSEVLIVFVFKAKQYTSCILS